MKLPWGKSKGGQGGGGFRDSRVQQPQGQGQGQQGGGDPGGPPQGGGGTNPGGWYEEDIFGNATWHSYSGEDLHGDEAKAKCDSMPQGGRDGITGESPHYWGGGGGGMGSWGKGGGGCGPGGCS